MNREILYRGKRTDNGEWVEGYYAKYLNLKHEIYTAILKFDNEDGAVYSDEITAVIPETVGEYTGLTDKNRKKIFEGDIVKFRINFNNEKLGFRYGTVIFDHGSFHIDTDYCFLCTFASDDDIEVIGNIHDNPELLEQI